MPKGLKVSRLLIVNKIPFIYTSNFFECKKIYTMTFRVAHWDTYMIVLCFNMQRDNIFERTNGKCHSCTL